MRCNHRPPTVPHLVWVYGESLTDKLDVATWLETSSELCKSGWRVTLVTAGPAGHLCVRGVDVRCIPKPQVYLLRQVVFHIRLLRFLAQEWATIDAILFHQMAAPWLLPLRLVRRLTGRQSPLLVMDTRDLPPTIDRSLRSRLRARFFSLVHWLANRWADGQTAITPRMAKLVGIPSAQLWGTWPSGVNPDQFVPAQTARRWPLAREPIHLTYIGVLLHVRNLLSLCQAVEKVNAAGMAFVLTLIGDGTARVDLEKFALQTAGRIRVIPPVPHDQIPRWLAQSHVGVTAIFSPDQELFQASSPIKLFEYMAAGLPILATRIVCHTDVVNSGDYAFWAEDASVEGLLAALHLIWHARSSLGSMGREAATAVRAWTWQESARKLKTALERGLQMSMGEASMDLSMPSLVLVAKNDRSTCEESTGD